MRKVLLPAIVLIALGVATILLVVFPLVASPRFITTNLSGDPIVLSVEWRDQSMNLGHVAPDKQIEFRLNDTATITFIARFPNGARISSPPMYFTTGTVLYARVYKSSIEVSDQKRKGDGGIIF